LKTTQARIESLLNQNDNFRADLAAVINKHSRENGSSTPDFILADYLADCLRIWDQAVSARDRWHGREDEAENEQGAE
jgi:hypothetical protein